MILREVSSTFLSATTMIHTLYLYTYTFNKLICLFMHALPPLLNQWEIWRKEWRNLLVFAGWCNSAAPETRASLTVSCIFCKYKKTFYNMSSDDTLWLVSTWLGWAYKEPFLRYVICGFANALNGLLKIIQHIFISKWRIFNIWAYITLFIQYDIQYILYF